MSQPPSVRKASPWPAIIAIGVLVMFAGLFMAEMAQVSNESTNVPVAEGTLTAETYAEVVDRLLLEADVTRGEALVKRYACVSCHQGAGAQNKLAPDWAGVATRAAIRRPPLTAAAYLYESIIHPRAHEIEGYSGQMPLIYGNTIPEKDLGDILAYLLTFED
jgi:mono/diheme cytochrome c family protein